MDTPRFGIGAVKINQLNFHVIIQDWYMYMQYILRSVSIEQHTILTGFARDWVPRSISTELNVIMWRASQISLNNLQVRVNVTMAIRTCKLAGTYPSMTRSSNGAGLSHTGHTHLAFLQLGG